MVHCSLWINTMVEGRPVILQVCVSLLERCPHFRGWYVQASLELGPEDVSLLERCPHFRGWYVYLQ